MAGHSCGKYANSWRKYAGISRFNPFPCLNMAKGKIIVMRLFGGLGNQLFQYAFLFALSRQGGKARLETSSYEHDDKRVCELHHFRVSLPIEGGPPPWAFRKSRIPACLRSLFAAPKYPHFREEKTARVRSRSRSSSPPPYLFQGIFSDGTILPPLPGTALQGIPSENSPDSGKRPHS